MAKNNQSIHEKLLKLASNYWWSWQPEVTALFREASVEHGRPAQLEELFEARLRVHILRMNRAGFSPRTGRRSSSSNSAVTTACAESRSTR